VALQGTDFWNDRGPCGVLINVEILVALALLILFDLAAWRWSFDSRVPLDDGRSVDPPSRRWI
jgi:hypothetical protein